MTMRRRFMTSRNTYNLEDYVHFTMLENGIAFLRDTSEFENLQWSINNGMWENTIRLNVKKGDVIALKAYGYSGNSTNIGYFDLPYCNLGGNIMSLYYGDDAKNHTQELLSYQFAYLFYKANIVSVSADFLPATKLAPYCYDSMFSECRSLVNAPELPATTLANRCYASMFKNCAKLNHIRMLATDISARNCLNNWVDGVSSSGTFVKSKDATWNVIGVSGIPSNWKIEYDHNYDIGSDISFHIERIDETLYAKDWMTWDDWVHSKYNTVSAFISSHEIWIPSYSSYPLATPDNIIKNGGTYYFGNTGGGSSD